MNKCGVMVVGRKMFSPLPPHTNPFIRRFFVSSAASEELSIKEIMEREIKYDIWQSLKQTEETRNNSFNSVSYNPFLKCFFSKINYLTQPVTRKKLLLTVFSLLCDMISSYGRTQ